MQPPDRPRGYPWLSVWTAPRATVRAAIDTGQHHMALMIAIASSIVIAFPDTWVKFRDAPLMLLFQLGVLTPLGGLITWWIAGYLLHWTGRWLGGTGTPRDLRIAWGFSEIPVIWGLPLTLAGYVWYGRDWLEMRPDSLPEVLFMLLQLVLGVWTVVILWKSVGEAHRFSAWRGLGACVLALLLLFGILLVIAFLFAGCAMLLR